MSVLIQAIGAGIASGAVIALGAVGFTVQFGISNVFNIAYGALMTLAVFIGYGLLRAGFDVWSALAVAAAAVGVASVALNRFLLEPLKRRGGGFVAVIIGTAYAGVFLQYGIEALTGATTHSYGRHWGSTIRALDMTFTTAQLVLIALTVLMMVAFHIMLTRSKLGRAMRATSSNRTLARASGIRTERIIDVTWLLTGCMCGAAGVALAITTVTFDDTIGATFLVYMIAAAVVGGIGQVYGAMAGALVIGVATQLAATYWNPALEDVFAFGILIVMLLFRPRGLFGAGGAGELRTA